MNDPIEGELIPAAADPDFSVTALRRQLQALGLLAGILDQLGHAGDADERAEGVAWLRGFAQREPLWGPAVQEFLIPWLPPVTTDMVTASGVALHPPVPVDDVAGMTEAALWEQLPERGRRLLEEAPDFGSGRLADATIEAYRRRISTYIISAVLLGFDPTPITPAKVRLHIRRLWTVQDKDGRPVAPSTIYMGVSALKWLIAHMRRGVTDARELSTIPDLGTDLKQVCSDYKHDYGLNWSERQADAIPYADFVEMLNNQDVSRPVGIRNQALLHMLTGTGCRPGEASALNLDMVDPLKDGTLRVRFARRKNDRGTDRHESIIQPHRQDPAHCPVRAILAWMALLRAGQHTTGALFVKLPMTGQLPSAIFERLTRYAITMFVERAGKRAGVEGRIIGHSGRVTCINWLTDADVGVELTAMHVGHASTESTRRYVRKATYKQAPMMTKFYDKLQEEQ